MLANLMNGGATAILRRDKHGHHSVCFLGLDWRPPRRECQQIPGGSKDLELKVFPRLNNGRLTGLFFRHGHRPMWTIEAQVGRKGLYCPGTSERAFWNTLNEYIEGDLQRAVAEHESHIRRWLKNSQDDKPDEEHDSSM